MTTPIAKNATLVAIEPEVTEGTYVAPSAGSSFIQTLEGIEVNPAKDLVEREVLTNSIGKVQPRVGLRSVSGSLPVEFKGSGTEGGAPEYGLLLESALGTKRSFTSSTTKTGNANNQLEIEDADISKYSKYDILVIKESGSYHVAYVTAVDTTASAANIQYAPTAPFTPSDNVEVAASQMYVTANDSHPSFSTSVYWADEIRQTGVGCKVTSLSLENFQTGQVPTWGISFDGSNYDRVDGSAPFTPSFDDALPPILQGGESSCVFEDGTQMENNNFSVELSNELSFVESICEGRSGASRMTSRTVSGSVNPYMDDTDVSRFTKFNDNTPFALFAYAANPSSTAGELELGSICAVLLPNCITTEMPTGDQEGLLTDDISFSANRGSQGDIEEMVVGFI